MSTIIIILLLGVATADDAINDDVIDGQTRAFPNLIRDFAEQIRKFMPGNLQMVWDLLRTILDNLNRATFNTLVNSAVNLVESFFPQEPVPKIPERLWGEGQGNSTVRPFKVHFDDEMISDLRKRIQGRRSITSSLKNASHTYGTNSEYLESFLDRWAKDYQFLERQEWLNKFPQFVTNIQGLDIHFIHIKSPNPHNKTVLPLLLIHGWPTTAFEYVHVIDIILQGREECNFVFEVVAPDLPGFGYSQATNQIGMSPYQMGVVLKNLMLRLKKPRFYIHAGDIGQAVGDAMAVLYPEKVLGLHTNFPFSLRPRTLVKYVLGQLFPAVVEPRYEDRLYPLTKWGKFYLENSGYFHMQASRPDNIGHGIDDSPVALASWFIEPLIVSTDPSGLLTNNGNLPQHYNMVEWFDDFTVYWATQCGTTSVRSYAEFSAWFQDPLSRIIITTPTSVPFAAIKFQHELIYQPDEFLKDKYPNLLQSSTLDFGGHFAAYEEPAVLVDSIWMSVKKMEAFHAK